MTTDPELAPVAQLRELLAKATPGNWCVVTGKNISVGPCPGQRVALCNYDNGPIEKANAAFIAKMHNALPALLDELDALRALRARVEAAPVGRVPRAKVGDLLLMSVSHDMGGKRVRLLIEEESNAVR